jgi:hypothetical protein
MLLDFGNKWIYSPNEFCCLFSQFLMVGIKDLLEGWMSNNGGRESELWSVCSRNELIEEEDDRCGPGLVV